MKILVLYTSYEGQTKKITDKIITILRQKSVQAIKIDVIDLKKEKETIDFSSYDSFLIGGSIRYGHYSPVLKKFIHTYYTQLNNKKSAFFGINLIARNPEKQSIETNSYTRKFLQQSPWKPTVSAVFAGALFYPRYSWFDRNIIRLIMKITGGETDTTQEIEYTDWQKVDDFANELVKYFL